MQKHNLKEKVKVPFLDLKVLSDYLRCEDPSEAEKLLAKALHYPEFSDEEQKGLMFRKLDELDFQLSLKFIQGYGQVINTEATQEQYNEFCDHVIADLQEHLDMHKEHVAEEKETEALKNAYSNYLPVTCATRIISKIAIALAQPARNPMEEFFESFAGGGVHVVEINLDELMRKGKKAEA